MAFVYFLKIHIISNDIVREGTSAYANFKKLVPICSVKIMIRYVSRTVFKMYNMYYNTSGSRSYVSGSGTE